MISSGFNISYYYTFALLLTNMPARHHSTVHRCVAKVKLRPRVLAATAALGTTTPT